LKVWRSHFVLRGLQGSYNALAAKYGFTVPHGAVWLFSIACAQIMYGFLLRPETLPKAYISWIDEAGQIPVEAVAMNRDLVRESSFRISDIDQLLTNPVRPVRFLDRHDILKFPPLGTSPKEQNRVVSPPGKGGGIPLGLWRSICRLRRYPSEAIFLS